MLVYADENTFSGKDEDPLFDANDELVFMARHLGTYLRKLTFPPFVNVQTKVEVAIQDPDYGYVLGYLYLFQSRQDKLSGKSLLAQNAGYKLVNYTFKLTTGDMENASNHYFDVYKLNCDMPKDVHQCTDAKMNPEDSWATSRHYKRHFSQNWHSDALHITTSGSDGQNIWAMEDFQFVLSDCSRCTRSFIQGPTAFVANIDGPVRAIR